MKAKKHLSQSNLYNCAQSRLAELNIIKSQIENELSKYPPGIIQVCSSKRNGNQFYLRASAQDKNGKYMSKKNPAKISTYLQKAYDERILKLAEQEARFIKEFIDNSAEFPQLIKSSYSAKCREIKSYLDPVDQSDEDFAEQWLSEAYNIKPISENAPIYITENNEQVRSKSELNIANMLKKYGVPYKYECPLRLKSGQTIYPDFTVLNVSQRKIMYWEHRGMMDDRDYAKHAITRCYEYTQSGIMLGRNLIITEETSAQPLGTDVIKAVIKAYFLQYHHKCSGPD